MTTKNARRMKYYAATMQDGTVVQLTKSIDGKYYQNGIEITETDDIKHVELMIEQERVMKSKRR